MLRRAICACMLLASSVVCAAQTATKSFRDDVYGVSFRYPVTWKLDTSSVDTGVPFYGSHDENGYPKSTEVASVSGGGTFHYAVSYTDTQEDCEAQIYDDRRSRVRIHGVDYLRVGNDEPGAQMGRQVISKEYATYREGSCYIFEEWLLWGSDWEATHKGAESYIHAQTLLLDEIMQSVVLGPAGAPTMQTFHDTASDVSFRYPAAWRLELPYLHDRDALKSYLGRAMDGSAGEIAIVGFPGIRNTNQGTVEFVYGLTVTPDEKSCDALMENTVAESGKTSEQVTLNGVRYWHVSGGEMGLGHGVERDIYATYREGRCLVFEEGEHTGSFVEEPKRRLSAAQDARISRELDAVMRSVVIGPKGERLTMYRDATRGVSFVYPAAWKAGASGRFSHAILPLDPDPTTQRMLVRWETSGKNDPKTRSKVVGMEFVYTEIPNTPLDACALRVIGIPGTPWGTEQVSFGSESYSMEHSGESYNLKNADGKTTGYTAERQIFETDEDERCILFELNLQAREGDGPPYPDSAWDPLLRVMNSVKIETPTGK